VSSEIKCPKSRIFTNNYWVGESDKVILQVSIAVFRALSKNFSGKDGSAPLEKIGPYTYVYAENNKPLDRDCHGLKSKFGDINGVVLVLKFLLCLPPVFDHQKFLASFFFYLLAIRCH